MVEDGQNAPDLALADANGEVVRLSSLKGQPVVVYFYPKDDTPGCTAQAKDFTCLADDFAKAGAQVIGISPDGPESHARFQAKHGLSVRLLADEAHAAAEAYGVWVERSMYGRRFMGIERSTFLIDAQGRVARSWRRVKVPGHGEEVLAAVHALGA